MAETTIHDILAQFREEVLNNRDLGDRFERLMCRYLELYPLFAVQFSNALMCNYLPLKGAMGDIGIDIVGEDAETGGQVVFLVPSLSLPSQTLREWTAYAHVPLHALAVCSDSTIDNHASRDSDDAACDPPT